MFLLECLVGGTILHFIGFVCMFLNIQLQGSIIQQRIQRSLSKSSWRLLQHGFRDSFESNQLSSLDWTAQVEYCKELIHHYFSRFILSCSSLSIHWRNKCSWGQCYWAWHPSLQNTISYCRILHSSQLSSRDQVD